MTAEPVTDVDVTAAEMLSELLDDLRERGVSLRFAELKGHVRERLDAYGILERIGPDGFYRTIGEAVKAYVSAEHAEWVDWTDRPSSGPSAEPG